MRLGFLLPKLFDLPSAPKKSKATVPSTIARTPQVQASAGRHYQRRGASNLGTLSNWPGKVINSILADREKKTVANRAWDLFTNDPMVHGIIKGLMIETINTGLSPQAQPMLEWLGKDTEWQSEYKKKAYQSFQIWGLDPRNFCDAQRRNNVYMLQALAYFLWRLDGVGIFQTVFRKDPAAPFQFCLLPIDPGRMTTPNDLDAKVDCYNGVVVDSFGAPTSVWLSNVSKGRYASYYGSSNLSQKDCTEYPVMNKKTGFHNILLVCEVENIAEYRQDSIITSITKLCRDRNDAMDAAIVKAVLSNMFVAWMQDESFQTAGTDWNDRIVELSSGMIFKGAQTEIPPQIISGGDEPGPALERVMEATQSEAGMATGRGSENVAKSYKASYSASQANIEKSGEVSAYERSIMVNRFCQPAEMIRQYECVLNGILPVTNWREFSDPLNLFAYTNTDWLPPPIRPIDKQKYANANDTDLKNKLKTRATIFGEQNRDWREEMRQSYVEEDENRKLAAEFGFDLEEQKQNDAANQSVQQALAQLVDDIEELKNA